MFYKYEPYMALHLSDKGMALFPEKVNGKYVMISRQGGEISISCFRMTSIAGKNFKLLMEPRYIMGICAVGKLWITS